MNAEGVYHLLLRAYPTRFRSDYEREMTLLFRDALRNTNETAFGFWLAIVWDVVRSATPMWIDVLRARETEHSQIVEVIMKGLGGVAVLLGFYGAVNAMVEAMAGMRGALGGVYLLAVALGGVAATLIITAGAALLRAAPTARQTATFASIASLMIILVARFAHPWMSVFSLIVGIALPIVLLAALRSGGLGTSTSEAA